MVICYRNEARLEHMLREEFTKSPIDACTRAARLRVHGFAPRMLDEMTPESAKELADTLYTRQVLPSKAHKELGEYIVSKFGELPKAPGSIGHSKEAQVLNMVAASRHSAKAGLTHFVELLKRGSSHAELAAFFGKMAADDPCLVKAIEAIECFLETLEMNDDQLADYLYGTNATHFVSVVENCMTLSSLVEAYGLDSSIQESLDTFIPRIRTILSKDAFFIERIRETISDSGDKSVYKAFTKHFSFSEKKTTKFTGIEGKMYEIFYEKYKGRCPDSGFHFDINLENWKGYEHVRDAIIERVSLDYCDEMDRLGSRMASASFPSAGFAPIVKSPPTYIYDDTPELEGGRASGGGCEEEDDFFDPIEEPWG